MKMNKYHQVSGIEISSGVLRLTVDGARIEKELEQISPALARASSAEQSEFEVSPSGYGIHWPLIDEDISIDGLLGISHHREPKQKIA
jgi:NAD(P)H-hydrate repair Nnr-like enzyme with NAD(P)H-hydrate epimerase domain